MDETQYPPLPARIVRLIAHTDADEITAWPTDVKLLVGQRVEWELRLDRSRSGEFPPTLEQSRQPFTIKFTVGGGFDDLQLPRADGSGLDPETGRLHTVARRQGTYHYEVAIAFAEKVLTLFGCPSGTVEKRK